MSPADIRDLIERLGWADETARQLVHAHTRKIRRGFARVLLADLRSLRAELDRHHREAWNETEA